MLLRPGPYICAEWEFGGMPSWLLNDDPAFPRTADPTYMSYAEDYLREVFAQVGDLQFYTSSGATGGPIIMVQVENEYGSYGVDVGDCDVEYLAFLRDKTWEGMGKETFLFTTDGYPLDRIR